MSKYKINDWRDSTVNKPCLLLGTGPSSYNISDKDIEDFKNKGGIVYGVNYAIQRFDLDVFVFFDYEVVEDLAKEIKEFKGIIWTRKFSDNKHLNWDWANTFSFTLGYEFTPHKSKILHQGNSTSFMALQLAYIAGCSPIILSGMDLDKPLYKKQLPGFVEASKNKENRIFVVPDSKLANLFPTKKLNEI